MSRKTEKNPLNSCIPAMSPLALLNLLKMFFDTSGIQSMYIGDFCKGNSICLVAAVK